VLDGWGQHTVAETGDSQRIGAGIAGFRRVSSGFAGSAQFIGRGFAGCAQFIGRDFAGCAQFIGRGFAGCAKLIGSGFGGRLFWRHVRRAHDQDRI
jgi:hypothetical protein